MNYEFTSDQLATIGSITDFLKSDNQVYSVQGYAGSGKTTLLTFLAWQHQNWKLCAFTGKAASVLREKSKLHASTVHALFYKFVNKEYDFKAKKWIMEFRKIHGPGSLKDTIVLLDESSMINEQMASDLIESGAKIITSGDPGQLKPVVGKQAFPNADSLLGTIHRQASDSAIIRQASSIRTTGMCMSDGDDFRIIDKLSNDDLINSDIILCWKNATRHRINKSMRKLKGFKDYPKAGEPVVCLKNARKLGLFNGAVYELAEDYEPYTDVIALKVDDRIQRVTDVGFVQSGQTIDDLDDELTTAFDYGYALTVHKAQGSEYAQVALIDEYTMHDREKWLYTGVTRASKKVVMQR